MAIVWVVVFWRLGYASLLDPDEAHYAELTREMVRAHSWLVPLLNGQPLIDKPVLYHWLQAASVWAFGDSEFALRLPSALAAVAFFALVRWFAEQWFGRNNGHAPAVMFATLPLTFALASIGVFDMVYGVFLFGAVATLLVAGLRSRPRLEYLGWPLLALAVMTKGPVAIVLVLLFGAMLMMSARTRGIVTRLHWVNGLSFVFLAAAPWFVWMAVTFRGDFVRDYLLAGNLYYFTNPLQFSHRQSNAAFYVRAFAGGFFPWSLVTLSAGLDSLKGIRRGRMISIEEQVLWCWLLLVLGFFTAAGFKLDYYIFPGAPAACMLAAAAWGRAAEGAPHTAVTRWAAFVIAVVFLAGGAFASVALFDLDFGFQASIIALPLMLAAAGIVFLAQLVHRGGLPPRFVTVPVSALLGTYAVVVVLGLPILEQSRPTAPLGRWIARHAPADDPVGIYGVDDWRASIRYYTSRPVARLDNPSDIRRFLEQYPQAFVLMLRGDLIDVQQGGALVRPVIGRRAIVGRTGKYLRRQKWGRLIVVTSENNLQAFADDKDGEELEPN